MSNDAANHRIALTVFPNVTEDPDKDNHDGLHHTAFEYDTFDQLNSSYLRLKAAGIEPAGCLDHGMTLSYYYRDPDGNHVELQVDNFGDWAKSSAFMREGPDFHADPIGKFVDPDRVAAAYAAGETLRADPRPRDRRRVLTRRGTRPGAGGQGVMSPPADTRATGCGLDLRGVLGHRRRPGRVGTPSRRTPVRDQPPSSGGRRARRGGPGAAGGLAGDRGALRGSAQQASSWRGRVPAHVGDWHAGRSRDRRRPRRLHRGGALELSVRPGAR